MSSAWPTAIFNANNIQTCRLSIGYQQSPNFYIPDSLNRIVWMLPRIVFLNVMFRHFEAKIDSNQFATVTKHTLFDDSIDDENLSYLLVTRILPFIAATDGASILSVLQKGNYLTLIKCSRKCCIFWVMVTWIPIPSKTRKFESRFRISAKDSLMRNLWALVAVSTGVFWWSY